jgi:hypothetical protein
MSRARNRPPRLEPHVPPVPVAAPPKTVEQLLERAKVAGVRAGGPGPTEFRRLTERIALGDRRALGELAPIEDLTALSTAGAFSDIFGASTEVPRIDPARTVAAARRAVNRVREVAAAGGTIVLATAAPASLLALHLAFAAEARDHGACVPGLPDVGPMRGDGRAGRALRWVAGVAAVTDGQGLMATRDGEVAREWIFVVPRPTLVVADGPFAEVAWETGLEVIALAGLDRPALAVAAVRGTRCTLVPLRTDRAPLAYEPLISALREPLPGPNGPL